MKLNGSVFGITPTLTTPPYMTLESVSTTQVVAIQEVTMGGELTSSTAMRTRVRRDLAVGTGVRSAGSVQRLDQCTTTPGNAAFFSTAYTTTAPTNQAGGLGVFSWNANGGYIRWLAAPGEEFIISVAASISSLADLGVGQSSYSYIWSEF